MRDTVSPVYDILRNRAATCPHIIAPHPPAERCSVLPVSISAWGNAITATASLVCLVAAIAAFLDRKRRIGVYSLIATYALFFPIRLWFEQFELAGPLPVSPVSISYIIYGPVIQIILFGIVPLIVSCFFPFKPVRTAFFLVYLFSLVLQFFSYLYWAYGTTRNFSIRLTHLDAFYFALGTLTTAGTGNISPVSETARELQAFQMAVDLAFTGFAVAIILARYSNLLSRPPVELPGNAVPPKSRQMPSGAARTRKRTYPASTPPIIRQMNARRRRRQLRVTLRVSGSRLDDHS